MYIKTHSDFFSNFQDNSYRTFRNNMWVCNSFKWGFGNTNINEIWKWTFYHEGSTIQGEIPYLVVLIGV